MTDVDIVIAPVSCVHEAGSPTWVVLAPGDADYFRLRARGDGDHAVRDFLQKVVVRAMSHSVDGDSTEATAEVLADLLTAQVTLIGAHMEGSRCVLVYTSIVPTPLAEPRFDLAAPPHVWRTLNVSAPSRAGHMPRRMAGLDAMVLDFWRQAFEETDYALDFLPPTFSLLQLRSLYDAVWGYDQDASGFKRWAVSRTGALRHLLDDLKDDPATIDTDFYDALGEQLPAEAAARAGALSQGDLSQAPRGTRLAVALAAATTANRLFKRPGPTPPWYRKSSQWHAGPTWIESVYPPRPDWTRWRLE